MIDRERSQSDHASIHTILEAMKELSIENRYGLIQHLRQEYALVQLPLLKDTPDITSWYILNGKAPNGDMASTTPLPLRRGTKDYIFMDLEASRILAVDTIVHTNAYLSVDLMTSSVLTARRDGLLVAAVISESEKQQMEYAHATFTQIYGFTPGEMGVVASVNQPLGSANMPARMQTVQDYVNMGILPEHITAFHYEGPSGAEPFLHRGLQQLIIGSDGTLVTSLDVKLFPKKNYEEDIAIEPGSVKELFIPGKK